MGPGGGGCGAGAVSTTDDVPWESSLHAPKLTPGMAEAALWECGSEINLFADPYAID